MTLVLLLKGCTSMCSHSLLYIFNYGIRLHGEMYSDFGRALVAQSMPLAPLNPPVTFLRLKTTLSLELVATLFSSMIWSDIACTGRTRLVAVTHASAGSLDGPTVQQAAHISMAFQKVLSQTNWRA